MTFPIFFALFLVSGIVSWATCLLVKKYGPGVGLVDKPGARKIHEVPIPTGGGLGIWLGVLIPIAAITLAALGYRAETESIWGVSLAKFPQFVATHIGGVAHRLAQLWTLLGLGSILVVLGTIDDRKGLPWQLRLGVEFLVAVAAAAAGWRGTFFLDCPAITWVVSVFWIVGLINSFNMLDNMDALSGGVATICSLFLAAVAFAFAPNPLSGEPQYFLGAFLLVLAGAILGFLKLNRPPAKMFMGDGGAYFIGFLLATTTLSITFVGDNTPKTAIFVPLCILAVPIYDTISVVTIRLRNHVSPFVGDKNHYSHRLVALGLSKAQAVATIYLTTAICATGAFFLYQVNLGTAILVFVQTALILVLVAILEFAARKKIRETQEEKEKEENDKTTR
ncbi:MAG: undecaprenyl/decaprenyl-phosphate alpha-N-acetylglucosaminyl 1-phosphate transferase [Thermoguttaceae bacterium]|nr:undecaprenyl/decaprenyl-phosphate alpha-N-acetylglucosaminyl 1-phosphate transferase [Thermoguttaceae bacterium]